MDRDAPWTRTTLKLIEKNPRVAASKLAAKLGRETLEFKTDVRKLKKLGLTQSFEVGYELSPRGKAYLAATTPEPRAQASGPPLVSRVTTPGHAAAPPMLAKRIDALPEKGDFLFEPKWDGFRTLVFRDGDEVFIQSRDEKPLGRYFPELEAPIRAQLPERCVLDGEIVIARAARSTSRRCRCACIRRHRG